MPPVSTCAGIKLLLAGDWRFPIYEAACAGALRRLGVEVIDFRWGRYFSGIPGRIQSKWIFRGPVTCRLNREFLARALECKPNIVFVWRGTHIFPETLHEIKMRTGAVLVAYNNDDPFSSAYAESASLHIRGLWRYWLKSIPEYDLHFVYRQVNLSEIYSAGAKQAYLLMPYYVPDLHYPVELNDKDKARYCCDAVFVGHYEDDGRVRCLQAMVDAGFTVKLFGGATWKKEVLGRMADYFGVISELSGIEYSKALRGADMALCFLSHLNRDVFTRRCFEIPACGGLLLSERTPDLQAMLAEGKDAVYFSTPEELVKQAHVLKDKPDLRRKIAASGQKRVLHDGHGVDARMMSLMGIVKQHLKAPSLPRD